MKPGKVGALDPVCMQTLYGRIDSSSTRPRPLLLKTMDVLSNLSIYEMHKMQRAQFNLSNEALLYE